MLQITIEHYSDGTASVQSVKDGKTVLAEMQEGYINLDVCTPYVERNIEIKHEYPEKISDNYSAKARLEAVEIENSTGLRCIRYSLTTK